MKHILVTGATGFIGRHVVDLLKQSGHQVATISKTAGDYLSPDFCREAVDGKEVVIHLAWKGVPHTSNEAPAEDVTQNVTGSIMLMQACVAAKVSRFIFMSSGGTVYGTPESIPIRESHRFQPISSYGITKLTVERYLHCFHESQGLDCLILRGANAYGPGQNFSRGQGVIGQWLNNLINGKAIRIYGDGSQIRDFVYVEDLAEAIGCAVERGDAGSILNIGSGQGHSLTEVLDTIQKVTGIHPLIETVPERHFDVPKNVLDCRLAASNLGWRSTTSLEEGIRRTWQWMKTQTSSER